MLTVVVIAKECVPGRVKTRLTPALSYEQAASVAFASLSDTLDVVLQVPADTRILAFDGDPDNAPDQGAGFEIIQQTCGGLDTRLAAIFDRCTGPTLLVGMDTPQLTAADLREAVDGLQATATAATASAAAGPAIKPAAWLGFANDGGFWALGMTHPDGALIRGVEMSRDDTGREQLNRLLGAGLDVSLLPELTDVDTFADAVEVSQAAPDSRFARAFAAAVATSTQADARQAARA